MAEKVEVHSGREYAERPTAFEWEGGRRAVREVTAEGRTPRTKWFRVIDERGEAFTLTYDGQREEWTILPAPKAAAPGH